MNAVRYFLLPVLLFLQFSISAQESNEITTVILVRHAEKVLDNSKNPELTIIGEQRAIKLKELLQNSVVSAIYSTNYKRTIDTVTPLAKAQNLEIMEYAPSDNTFINKIVSERRGQTLVVCGHSNTIPQLVNQLLSEEKYADIDESQYSKIYIVSISSIGDSKVVELSY